MTQLEVMDRLCQVIHQLSELVRKQAEIIEQAKISDKVSAELEEMRKAAEAEIDIIECESYTFPENG